MLFTVASTLNLHWIFSHKMLKFHSDTKSVSSVSVLHYGLNQTSDCLPEDVENDDPFNLRQLH